MLTERECWERIEGLVRSFSIETIGGVFPSTADVEKLEVYVNLILIRRRVEALEE